MSLTWKTLLVCLMCISGTYSSVQGKSVSEKALNKMRTKQLKAFIAERGEVCKGCYTKQELVAKAIEIRDLPIQKGDEDDKEEESDPEPERAGEESAKKRAKKKKKKKGDSDSSKKQKAKKMDKKDKKKKKDKNIKKKKKEKKERKDKKVKKEEKKKLEKEESFKKSTGQPTDRDLGAMKVKELTAYLEERDAPCPKCFTKRELLEKAKEARDRSLDKDNDKGGEEEGEVAGMAEKYHKAENGSEEEATEEESQEKTKTEMISDEALSAFKVKQLKGFLAERGASCPSCVTKSELLEKAKAARGLPIITAKQDKKERNKKTKRTTKKDKKDKKDKKKKDKKGKKGSKKEAKKIVPKKDKGFAAMWARQTWKMCDKTRKKHNGELSKTQVAKVCKDVEWAIYSSFGSHAKISAKPDDESKKLQPIRFTSLQSPYMETGLRLATLTIHDAIGLTTDKYLKLQQQEQDAAEKTAAAAAEAVHDDDHGHAKDSPNGSDGVDAAGDEGAVEDKDKELTVDDIVHLNFLKWLSSTLYQKDDDMPAIEQEAVGDAISDLEQNILDQEKWKGAFRADKDEPPFDEMTDEQQEAEEKARQQRKKDRATEREERKKRDKQKAKERKAQREREKKEKADQADQAKWGRENGKVSEKFRSNAMGDLNMDMHQFDDNFHDEL